MSTLPFLLSVADELDNINSQSYMDDFGLGFHPHRQYYRSPTIQLSLPASTEWMQQDRHRGYRSNKYSSCDEYHGHHSYGHHHAFHLPPTTETDADGGEGGPGGSGCGGGDDDEARGEGSASGSHDDDTMPTYLDKYGERRYGSESGAGGGGPSSSARGSKGHRQRYTSPLNCNGEEVRDGDNIDSSVQMYNLSKKCSKNYHHRHSDATTVTSNTSLGGAGGTASSSSVPLQHASPSVTGGGTTATTSLVGLSSASPSTSSAAAAAAALSRDRARGEGGGGGGLKLHRKCLEGNNSSSDESLQKPTSSIEFLTCFLLKKSRTPKGGSGGISGGFKKS